MRKIVLVGAGAAVAVAGLVGFAGPAAAETSATATITQPTTGYQWPTKDSPAVMTGLQQGQKVTALCFGEGDPVNNNPYWFRISLTPTPDGNTAFVHRDAISVANNNLANCWPKGS